MLGKPYEPNGIVKSDTEFILLFRKPGGYRQVDDERRLASLIPADLHRAWFTQVWSDVQGAHGVDHPAPYPVALAERLVRMFSFVGDTVLDNFLGSGSSVLAAAAWGRNSIGVDIEPRYVKLAAARLQQFIDKEGLPAKVQTEKPARRKAALRQAPISLPILRASGAT
jgi:modification methylase